MLHVLVFVMASKLQQISNGDHLLVKFIFFFLEVCRKRKNFFSVFATFAGNINNGRSSDTFVFFCNQLQEIQDLFLAVFTYLSRKYQVMEEGQI